MIVQSIKLQSKGSSGAVSEKNKGKRDTELPKITSLPKKKVPTSRNAKKSSSQSLPQLPLVTSQELKSNPNLHLETTLKEKTLREIALERLSQPPLENCGRVIVRLNHYGKTFPIHNGVLQWKDIDEEYALSFAYKGNFIRTIYQLPKIKEGENLYRRIASVENSAIDETFIPLQHDTEYQYFLDAVIGEEYLLKVEEDPDLVQETSQSSKIIFDKEMTPSLPNRAVHLLTNELKGIAPKDLNSDLAKDLIERRDIEDVLFSGL
jgi:hypothetical protein